MEIEPSSIEKLNIFGQCPIYFEKSLKNILNKDWKFSIAQFSNQKVFVTHYGDRKLATKNFQLPNSIRN